MTFPKYIDQLNIHAKNQYVAWIDIMGTKSHYKKTKISPAIFILKLQSCGEATLKKTPDARWYLAGDGLFVTHDRLELLLGIVKEIFQETAKGMINEKKIEYRFMIRGGLAYGNVIHGENLNEIELLSEEKKKSLVFGKALAAAIEVERSKPPFSIFIDESSNRYFTGSLIKILKIDGKKQKYYSWFDDEFTDKEKFITSIDQYYKWVQKNKKWGYPQNKIEEHHNKFILMCS